MVEQDDAEIIVTNIINPASFLSGNQGEPVHHDCLETIEASSSSCPDLKDTPWDDAETWFTDGTSHVISGQRHAGYAVTTCKVEIESGPLPIVFCSTLEPGTITQLCPSVEPIKTSGLDMDLGSICTTVPKAMHNSLWHTNNISYSACAAQVFFFAFFMSAEFSLLTIMCYDRYVSICKPLHYGTLLGSRACAHMAAAAWASAFLNALLHTANTFSLPLCQGNALGQFFCEIPQILKLSCSNSYIKEFGLIVFSICLGLGCFLFIVFSYVQIFRAVLRIPSEQGRHKAFSTCLPHLAVVSLFVITGLFTYLKPPSISSPSLDLALSVLYSVVPPDKHPQLHQPLLRGAVFKTPRQPCRFLWTHSSSSMSSLNWGAQNWTQHSGHSRPPSNQLTTPTDHNHSPHLMTTETDHTPMTPKLTIPPLTTCTDQNH
ncbi:olfactory receptor 14J1-like [Cinclus cinclus]|uniref:olfactory receptor 14J1-like n=1 Tax=Cinclus cinclus TaxID=127875 RepID=UPI002E1454B3